APYTRTVRTVRREGRKSYFPSTLLCQMMIGAIKTPKGAIKNKMQEKINNTSPSSLSLFL
ncbi:hypothetical protein, partial [Tetragenococcus halophilus]|uniref:hypothetical protein n=1 Tax=Tetragenococcus halophilus TaxID=51669 RepID=UPI00295F1090